MDVVEDAPPVATMDALAMHEMEDDWRAMRQSMLRLQQQQSAAAAMDDEPAAEEEAYDSPSPEEESMRRMRRKRIASCAQSVGDRLCFPCMAPR